MSKNELEQQGLSKWLEQNFTPRAEIRTPEDFNNKVSERLRLVENLLEKAYNLRRTIREEVLNVPPDVPCVVLGEQAVGLNEPPLILGKRFLAKVMEKFFNWRVVSYHLGADVLGSEPGLHRVTLPNPSSPKGKEEASIVSRKKWGGIPTNGIPAREIKAPKPLVSKIYSNSNRALEVIKRYEPTNAEESYADIQNKLLLQFLQELGLYDPEDKVITNDIEFDTIMAQMGGLELIMEIWYDILAMTRQENEKRRVCRVPDNNEAPFFILLEIEDKKGKTTIRAPVVINDDENKTFSAYPPRYKQKGVDSPLYTFTIKDVLEGNVSITWRAIPRVILFALAFDAHISGGGALYNQVVARPFETLFNFPYFPIAHLDLVDETGKKRSPFIYCSYANRKRKAPYLELAKNAEEQGLVSTLDMAMSIDPEIAKEIIENTIQNFKEIGQRIDLREASIIRY